MFSARQSSRSQILRGQLPASGLPLSGLLLMSVLSCGCSIQMNREVPAKVPATAADETLSNVVSMQDGQQLGAAYILDISASRNLAGVTWVRERPVRGVLTLDVRSAVAARVHCYYAEGSDAISRLPVAFFEESFSPGQHRRWTVLDSQSGKQSINDITTVLCLAFDHADLSKKPAREYSLPADTSAYRSFDDVYELYRTRLPGNVVGRSTSVRQSEL